jgi:hypothetical protein
MACSCNNSYYNLPCCCPTVPPTTTTTTLCPDGTVCEEVIESDCVLYTGFELACYGISQGSTLTEIIEELLDLLPECPINFNANVTLGLTGCSIISFSTTLYTTVSTGSLPVTVGNSLTARLTTALANSSLTVNVTTGTVDVILLVIVNNIVVKSITVLANQINFGVVIPSLTWLISDKVTIQMIAK